MILRPQRRRLETQGMHGNTFERFLKAEEEANRASTLAMVKHMRMFERAGYL